MTTCTWLEPLLIMHSDGERSYARLRELIAVGKPLSLLCKRKSQFATKSVMALAKVSEDATHEENSRDGTRTV
jgi:hypothetical protein